MNKRTYQAPTVKTLSVLQFMYLLNADTIPKLADVITRRRQYLKEALERHGISTDNDYFRK